MTLLFNAASSKSFCNNLIFADLMKEACGANGQLAPVYKRKVAIFVKVRG